MKKALAMALALVMMVGLLAGCGPKIVIEGGFATGGMVASGGYDNDLLPFDYGTELRMAVGYNSKATGLFFSSDIAGAGVTLADGITYNSGDLKPTWVEVQNILGMKFIDCYQGNTDSKEFDFWKEKLGDVDMVAGSANQLGEYGTSGNLVNITEYLDQMPNFKAYLDANPIVRMAITSKPETGDIYISPYFDGVDDIERMPLMRTDWVEKLLDGQGAFSAASSDTLAGAIYQPYMPTSGKIPVSVVNSEGTGLDLVTKDYDAAGNIVANMNAAGALTGVDAVNMLRDYIDTAYNGYYGTKRSDLFVGQNAAWDADELVALLRCVTSNSATLNGDGNKVEGMFTREENSTQRRLDLVHFAGILFGVRGTESRKDYLYVGTDGLLHDARQEEDMYLALERMNAMAKEGLISSEFIRSGEVTSEQYLKHDIGFMHYDYNQTQTMYNEDGSTFAEGEQYMAAMVPVARWYDGTDPNGVYMRFTESWRSVKTGGWGISKAGVGDDINKLNACLALIDFAYTDEGMTLLSYGPKAFRASTKFSFNGEKWPEITDACRAELWDKAGGNYTNYARRYLGATLSFVKCQSFEYQCTTEVGRRGAGYISNAIALGIIKHPKLDVNEENMWYTSVPTTLPTTEVENNQINSYTSLGTAMFGTSKDTKNILVDMIVGGYQESGMNSAATAARTVADDWSGKQYLMLQNGAWEKAMKFYETLK